MMSLNIMIVAMNMNTTMVVVTSIVSIIMNVVINIINVVEGKL